MTTETPNREEQLKWATEWHAVAVCYGYNLLAMEGKSLGKKMYFRKMRDDAEAAFMAVGVSGGDADQETYARISSARLMEKVRQFGMHYGSIGPLLPPKKGQTP